MKELCNYLKYIPHRSGIAIIHLWDSRFKQYWPTDIIFLFDYPVKWTVVRSLLLDRQKDSRLFGEMEVSVCAP